MSHSKKIFVKRGKKELDFNKMVSASYRLEFFKFHGLMSKHKLLWVKEMGKRGKLIERLEN